ncbi:MAG: hypothetical protein O2945_21195 [Planctomycetota bacterium]|nr:hypothetical protein [Planctomycetota bacterium]MDA0921592.1 hypothetical protein [Planctomycetota bacterium]
MKFQSFRELVLTVTIESEPGVYRAEEFMRAVRLCLLGCEFRRRV